MNTEPAGTDLCETCRQCIAANSRNIYACGDACFGLIEHALMDDDHDAWTCFYKVYTTPVTTWVAYFSNRYGVSSQFRDLLVNRALFRYWRLLNRRFTKLRDYQHAINYLRLCVKSSVYDYAPPADRFVEVELTPQHATVSDPPVDEFAELWAIIEQELTDPHDRQLTYCYCVLHLKPQAILKHMPGVYADTKQIKTEWQRVRRQLRRNMALRLWFGIRDIESS
jgi:hypothetical protein